MRMRRAFAASVVFALVALALPGVAQQVPSTAQWIQVSPTSDLAFAHFEIEGRSHFAFSPDGGTTVIRVRPADEQIRLRYSVFDPLSDGIPAVPAELAARPDAQLRVVQYWTSGVGAYRDALRAAGAEVLHFVPGQGNLVRVSDDQLSAVQNLPFVRWVGPFQPAYRTDEVMRAELEAGAVPTRDYWIHVTRKGRTEKARVADHIRALGGIVVAPVSPHGFLLRARLDGRMLVEVLHRDDVLFVDRWSDESQLDMDQARQVFGASYVENVAGFTGAGVRGEVRDSGFNAAHVDFQNIPPLWHTAMNNASHGSSTYGIVFGDGTGNPAGRGVIPDGQGIMAWSSNIPDRYVHTQQLNAAPYEAVFQTSSVGSARTFFYTNISANMDNLLFDLDSVKTQSQSNAGNQDSRPEAWAKNIVSVGGIRHYDTASTADDAWASGASIGPAQDGRIKPDICAFYDSIFTTTSGSPTAYTTGFGGTSGATPIVAGHFGLFFQMWSAGIFGNTVNPMGTVFSNRPHMTTSKAMMIGAASQYPFVGENADLTRVHQGWGRADAQTLYDQRTRIFVVDETDLLSEFETRRYDLMVGPADPEFQATLVFADPSGNPAATQARINDLTLRVIDPAGNVYWGNNGLLANNNSTTGGQPNTVDTVEQVIVASPMQGIWSVDVICFELNQDGHVETAALDADYALVVRGVNPTPIGGSAGSGQANSLAASLRVLGAVNGAGQPASLGINGPFFADLAGFPQLALRFEAPPQRAFILLRGPLNANNLVLPAIGSLDLGLLGGTGNISDVEILLDGLAPTTFLDLLATVGSSGLQTLSFPLPAGAVGSLGAIQAAMIDPLNPTDIVLTAAFQLD